MHLAATTEWATSEVELFALGVEHVGPAYVRWLNDPLVHRFLESRFAVHTEESTRAFVEGCLADPRTLLLGIRSIQLGGRHVGNIKLNTDPHHNRGEVGILIGEPSAWGQGIASQAITILAKIASRELSLGKLTAGCYASNVGSEKAFIRAGFETEGRRRAHFLLEGKPEDLLLMAKWL